MKGEKRDFETHQKATTEDNWSDGEVKPRRDPMPRNLGVWLPVFQVSLTSQRSDPALEIALCLERCTLRRPT